MALTTETYDEVEVPREEAQGVLTRINQIIGTYPHRQDFSDPCAMASAFRTRITITLTVLPQEGPE